MNSINQIQPVMDGLKPQDKSAKVDDPQLKSLLNFIDQFEAVIRSKRKAEDEAKLEARRLQAEFDKQLAFLKSKVESAYQAMMSVKSDLPPGVVSPEQRNYNYWVSQLASFKQQGGRGSLV